MFLLPTALAYPLFYKLAQPGATTVSLHAVQAWIMQRNVLQARWAPLSACTCMRGLLCLSVTRIWCPSTRRQSI